MDTNAKQIQINEKNDSKNVGNITGLELEIKGLAEKIESLTIQTKENTDSLYKLQKKIDKQNEGIFKKMFKGDSSEQIQITELNQQIQGLKTRNQQLEQKNRKLESDFDTNKQQLEQKIHKLESDYDTIKQDHARLVIELHGLKRDKTATYTESSQPQHHSLSELFRHLKENDFQNVSREIFKFHQDYDPEFKKKYPKHDKFEIARIRSLLAKEIFIKSKKLLDQETENGIKILIRNVIKAVSDYSGKQCRISQPIETNIVNITKKGFNLLKDIIGATPSGELIWIEKEENKDFDSNINDVITGYEEKGKIELTVYPGYFICDVDNNKKRILEKALVLTESKN